MVYKVHSGHQSTCYTNFYNLKLLCFGNNLQGKNDIPQDIIQLPVLNFTSGYTHTCAVKLQMNIICWGANEFGQVDVPSLLSNSHLVMMLDSGNHHNCIIDFNGTIGCWGNDTYGQTSVPGVIRETEGNENIDINRHGGVEGGIGDANSTLNRSGNSDQINGNVRYQPYLKAYNDTNSNNINININNVNNMSNNNLMLNLLTNQPPLKWVQLSAGGMHNCAINAGGRLVCWGRGSEGQLNTPNDMQAEIVSVGAG